MKPQVYHVDAFTSQPFRGNSAGVVSVSYTHLDVYKRQAQVTPCISTALTA